MSRKQWMLSATAIQAFKACPRRFYLRYVCGLKPIEETDSLRQGTNWHKILEIRNTTENPSTAIAEHLNKQYAEVPLNKTKEEWETERIVLLYSLAGYSWYYGETDKQYSIVTQEQKFSIPLLSLTSRRALPGVVINGKIDKVLQDDSGIFIEEHKSTSKSIDSDSSYWNHLALDTQTHLYPYAARQIGLGPVRVLFDVWHKPQISPKKLTQGESQKFVTNGQYCDQIFNVGQEVGGSGIVVNNTPAEVEPGAKKSTFAIRETPEMFGARLLQDITVRPEFYFARREIARTDRDLEKFERELFNIYQTIRSLYKTDGWWCDETQCEATFKCPFVNICYNNIQVKETDMVEGFTKEVRDETVQTN